MGAESAVVMFSLFFGLFAGGSNELLDFVPTNDFWKARGITISVEHLKTDTRIAPGNSKAQGIRKLMAIRTLGERKEASALPTLKELLTSREMFVADYAARAIAQIENRPGPAASITPEKLVAESSLLPGRCTIVGQSRFSHTSTLQIGTMIQKAPAEARKELGAGLELLELSSLRLADQIGNFRVDSVTIGVSDVVDEKNGFAVAIAAGEYDSRAAIAALRKLGVAALVIDGVEVFNPDERIAICFTSDRRAIMVASMAAEKSPLKEVLAATRSEKLRPHPLLGDPAFAAFISSINQETTCWAICKVSDSYRAAPLLGVIDTIELLSQREKNGVSLRLNGSGKNADAVKAAVEQFKKQFEDSKQSLTEMTRQLPSMKLLNDFVQSVQFSANGRTVQITGAVPEDIAGLLARPFMLLAAEPGALERARNP